jgi:hypothetical protein
MEEQYMLDYNDLKEYEPIYVKNSNNNDTRTCDHMPSRKELLYLSSQHIQDVMNGINFLCKLLLVKGAKHDYTKITLAKEQWEDFKTVYDSNNEINFCDLNWCKTHYLLERHHLNDYVPIDVNLLDVIEMVVDCTMAGLGRSETGEIYPVKISDEILQMAVKNTVELVKDQVIIVKEE